MPCPAWGIDPKHCVTGAQLRKQKGTTCSICYACKGNYCFPNVRKRQEERLAGITHQLWVQAMVLLITHECCTHFRWLDSGDLQSPLHLLKIILIAIQMPDVQFWLPTQEHRFVRTCTHPVPDNLIIRLTNPVIDPVREIRNAPLQAEVQTDPTIGIFDGFVCQADIDGTRKCGDCRACWNKQIKKIIYRRH